MKRSAPTLLVLIVAVVAIPLGRSGTAQGGRRGPCDSAAATVNWVRENLSQPGISEPEQRRVLAHLELSTQSCVTNGDLWYYRYTVESHLKLDAAKFQYSRRKAEEWRSEALARNIDPFAPVQTGLGASGPVENKWALVVGVGTFQDEHLRALKYAAHDAEELQRALVDPDVGRFRSDRVHLLTDGNATFANVLQEIGWLRANAGPNDLVLVYFASHGLPRSEDQPNGVSLIALHDTNDDDVPKLYSTTFQMIDVADRLSRDVRAGRVMLILDTCYSGDVGVLRFDASTMFSAGLAPLAQAPGRVILAAAAGNQLSHESDRLQHGYFTYFLIDALRKSRGNSPVRGLFNEVYESVAATVQRDERAIQTPIVSGSPDVQAIPIGIPESASKPG